MMDLEPAAGPKARQTNEPEREQQESSGKLQGEAGGKLKRENVADKFELNREQRGSPMGPLLELFEKSVIIHKDENGFGLRIKGQTPVYIEHVHEGGAAWRAGVRDFDSISKVNGVPVDQMDHKDVVLMFKSCSRFVALTLISPGHHLVAAQGARASLMSQQLELMNQVNLVSQLIGSKQRQYSIYSHSSMESRYCFGTAGQRRLASSSQNSNTIDTSSLFASNDYAIDTAPSLLMDRTRSCRSTASGNHHHQHHLSGAAKLQQQQKLVRRDSNELEPVGDKRVAICTCCQQQQCQRSPQHATEPAGHKHQIQRQLNQGQRELACDRCGDQEGQGPVVAASLAKFSADQLGQSKSSASLPTCQSAGQLCGTVAATKSRPADSKARGDKSLLQQPMSPSVNKPKVMNKRVQIIREFIDTERTHTERLRCLDELFYRPLKQYGFMTSEQLRKVFSCHRTLYKIHRQIHRILLSANFDIYSEPLVGSALLEIFEGELKRRLERAACSFCSAQATNVELLNKLTRRDTKVGEFLAQVTSQQMIGRLGIKDLLASCFQRLTKYPLLLENLLKSTPQISPDELEHELDRESRSAGEGADRLPMDRAGRRRRRRRRSSLLDFGTGDDHHEEEGRYDDDDDNQVDDDDEDDGEFQNSDETEDDEEARQLRLGAAIGRREEARRNSRRMLAISLAEEREFIERALVQSRQILVRVNESIRVALSRNKLEEIWKRTDKYPGVPLIDITKQQVVHEGLLTLRLSKRSFDVYVLLLNDYIIILTREGQDKYRLKFFTPEGKSASGGGGGGGGVGSSSSGLGAGGASGSGSATIAGSQAAGQQAGANSSANTAGGQSNLTVHQAVYSPVFVIDEHLTTRDAATDENGFYLLCKRKDDSRIYEFASRSPAERMKWRDKIQWTIERQVSRSNRRTSCGSTLTKSSSDISANGLAADSASASSVGEAGVVEAGAGRSANDLNRKQPAEQAAGDDNQANDPKQQPDETATPRAGHHSRPPSRSGGQPTKIVGTISYVIDDGIVMPNKMESSRVLVDQAIQVNILDGGKVSAARSQPSDPHDR